MTQPLNVLLGAIEEVLRLESPFRYYLRHATTELSLLGVTIPKDASVLLILDRDDLARAVFLGGDRAV